MDRIKTQFQRMEDQTGKLREKIDYYENEGRLSQLLKKVMKLEE